MTTAVIGSTGRVGSEIVRGLLVRGDAVTVLVRDHGKARRAFGEPDGLHIRLRCAAITKTAGADAGPVVSAAEARACSRSSAGSSPRLAVDQRAPETRPTIAAAHPLRGVKIGSSLIRHRLVGDKVLGYRLLSRVGYPRARPDGRALTRMPRPPRDGGRSRRRWLAAA